MLHDSCGYFQRRHYNNGSSKLPYKSPWYLVVTPGSGAVGETLLLRLVWSLTLDSYCIRVWETSILDGSSGLVKNDMQSIRLFHFQPCPAILERVK